MSGSPWFGVLMIAGLFGGGLFLALLLAKAKGLRTALNGKFHLPILIGLLLLGLAASALVVSNGIGSGAVFCFLLAINLVKLAEAPRPIWARVLLWLDGALLAGVTLWAWKDLRTFAADDLVDQLLTLLVLGAVLFAAAVSLYRLVRPKAGPPPSIAETGTPA